MAVVIAVVMDVTAVVMAVVIVVMAVISSSDSIPNNAYTY